MIQSSALPKTFCQLVFTNFNFVTTTTALLILYSYNTRWYDLADIHWGVTWWSSFKGQQHPQYPKVECKARRGLESLDLKVVSLLLYLSSSSSYSLYILGHRAPIWRGLDLHEKDSELLPSHTYTHGNGHQRLSRSLWDALLCFF